MKRIKIILIILIVNIILILNVNAIANPYSKTSSYGTNCTWYAWKMAYEKGGVTLPGWGNAKDWYNDAKKSGYSVGTTPKANSIIVWENWTSYGHVGYVESVGDNVLYVWDSASSCIDKEDPEFRECMENGVSEESDKICYANAKRIACEYTISPSDYEITGYIYLDNAPTPTTTTTTTEKIKSNNNNLNNIELSEGIINFDKNTILYEIEVENKIDKITINAILEDNTANLEGVGSYELVEGINEIKLIVTAENNDKKEYTIKIIRKEKNTTKEEIKLEDNTINNNKIIILSSISLIILVFIIIIVIYKKRRNNEKKSKKR